MNEYEKNVLDFLGEEPEVNEKIKLYQGNNLDVLKTFEDNSIDSIVTDPPAGISFMNKGWDHDKGGRNEWIKWLSEVMTESKRTLKPGGHMFVWALPRTSHWTATACEDAGFEIRDVVVHVFGSGFPKSLNIGKAIDKKIGVEPTIIGEKPGTWLDMSGRYFQDNLTKNRKKINETIPTSEEAKLWEGWGTNLKPASEHWILCRKPISEKTIADNVLKWGTGGLNIDKSRIGTEGATKKVGEIKITNGIYGGGKGLGVGKIEQIEGGRFPANLIHDGSDEVMKEFAKAGNRKSGELKAKEYNTLKYGGNSYNKSITKNISNGFEPNEGSAARFFYCSKASGKEKNEGLIDCKSTHPTIKPVKLMSYLINMITPVNGIVLDPFMGSGSTGVAALLNNFNFIGIELDPEYFKIAEARINSYKAYEKL